MNRTLTVEIAFVCMVSLCHADIAKSLDRNLEWDRKTNLFDAPEKKRRRSAEGEIFLP